MALYPRIEVLPLLRLPIRLLKLFILLQVCRLVPFTRGDSVQLDDESPVNPYARGCLTAHGLTDRWRVCNSDDQGDERYCRPSEFPSYLEIRVKCQDWESVTFSSWVLQIVLSELLQVPTTLETGDPTAVMQFYDANDRFEFGTSANNFAAFYNAQEAGGDCRNVVQPLDENGTVSEYKNCAHIIPEVWTARSNTVRGMIREGVLDPPTALGALGTEGWYVPKFTLDADPSLASWVGLAGEAARSKLARMFLRPTTWGVYCEEYSPTKCLEPDGVATRPPDSGWQETNLFSEGGFIGYFRNTTENDCEAFPHNCTGHVGDFPCGWGGTLEATCHHLNIAMRSSGGEPYSRGWTYSQLGQMWKAANATRNHVAMMWAIPDPVYEEFMGTEFEFVKVTLPAPTQTCLVNRIVAEDRCSPDPALRLGTALGVCDELARPLHKLVLAELVELTKGSDIPLAIRSPAHDVLSQFAVTELQINEMFRNWQTIGSPREAICQWVVDNLEDLQQSFIPRTFPRTFESSDAIAGSSKSVVLKYITAALGVLALLLVLGTAVMVFYYRKRRVFRYAQTEFLYLLLAGAAMVAVGAILRGLENPTDATCVTSVWLTSLGYTFELVPLLVKVAAINRLMQAASRMRRVKLQRSSLRGGVAIISMLMILALLAWTIFDPPQSKAEYELSNQLTDDLYQATIIRLEFFCESNSAVWEYVAVIWNVVLILCATALAFQSRSVKSHFNESQTLSKLIYSHFLFCMLRVMAFFFPPKVADPMLSIIFSLDTVLVVLIYFVPKFMVDDRECMGMGRSSSRISGLDNSVVSHFGRERLENVGNSFRMTMQDGDAVSSHDRSHVETASQYSSVGEDTNSNLPKLPLVTQDTTTNTQDSVSVSDRQSSHREVHGTSEQTDRVAVSTEIESGDAAEQPEKVAVSTEIESSNVSEDLGVLAEQLNHRLRR